MRIAAVLLTAALLAPTGAPAAPPTRVVTASGPLAVLNGVAVVDLQAVAPLPLGLPAPAGQVSIAWQSTFEPPGPRSATVMLWCTAVVSDASGTSFYGSGYDRDDRSWFVRLRTGEVLWELGVSTSGSSGPCGAGSLPTAPLIGVAAITP